MTITAKVIADSTGAYAPRLTTLQLRYPRFIHSEFMTHRVFSRNASSSRAVPISKVILDIDADPAMPEEWGSNQSGMQAGADLVGDELEQIKQQWLWARDMAIISAEKMQKLGGHKQLVNRILEPFSHISVIVTASDWDNFFKLRLDKAADPTMRKLAEAMKAAMDASTPERLGTTGMHLPYFREAFGSFSIYERCMISAGRCARVSYLNHDGSSPSWKKDIELAERLLDAGHMSPFEHQATPDSMVRSLAGGMKWVCSDLHGNFTGWLQFRKQREQVDVRLKRLAPEQIAI